MRYLCLRNSTPQRPVGKAAKFCDSTLAQVRHNLSAKKFLKHPPDRKESAAEKRKSLTPKKTQKTMAINIKAVERKQYVGKYAGQYRYQMAVESYNTLTERKVMEEASAHSGIGKGALQAAWVAIADVIKTWATEGHRVAIPGLGTMRFGVNSKTVSNVDEVSKELISTRKVLFTPNTDIKQELQQTGISITCYDRNGNVVKRVQSADDGSVEDPESPDNGDDNGSGGGNGLE